MLQSRLYREGRLIRSDLPLEELAAAADQQGCALWVDCTKDDVDTIRALAEQFDLHPVAVEDALGEHERPKIDRYDAHVYAIAYTTRLEADAEDPSGIPRLRFHDVSIFSVRNAVITVRQNDQASIARATEVWESHPELLEYGSVAILWAVLDEIVDSHFDTVQALEERAVDVEDLIFGEHPDIRLAQRRLYRLHKMSLRLRRITLPTREIVGTILRFGSAASDGPLAPYFQDVYDHALRVGDWMENLHDIISTLFDSNLTAQSNRMNEVMKKVTSWAAIIAVPTLVTGYFGMNVAFPLLNTFAGWLVAICAIIIPSAVLFWLFRRSDWL